MATSERTSAEWVDVVAASEVADGCVRSVRIDGRKWALAKVDGELHVLEARCPHKLGPLDRAQLSAAGELVCPWHLFRFDPASGRCTQPSGAFPELERLPARVVGGVVQVQVTPVGSSTGAAS